MNQKFDGILETSKKRVTKECEKQFDKAEKAIENLWGVSDGCCVCDLKLLWETLQTRLAEFIDELPAQIPLAKTKTVAS